MKDTIVIHRDWLIPTDEMSDAEYRAYMDAIFSYAFEGRRSETGKHRPLLRLVFKFVDDYEAKYDRAIQQRREAVKKRWEKYREKCGEVTNDTTEYDRIRPNTGDTDTVTDTVTVTDTDTDVQYIPNGMMGTDKINNKYPLNPPKGGGAHTRVMPDEFVSLWSSFKGKRKSIDLDFMDFCKKTDGLTVDYARLQHEAGTAKDVNFQTWLNGILPKNTGKQKRFIPPTVEDVRAYCEQRGNGVDPERFIDFYESKGWVVGKSPMKDWKAAVRTWEQRDGRGPKKTATGSCIRLGPGEFIDNGRRTYGTGEATIPPDAPPRPSDKHLWDALSGSWILF